MELVLEMLHEATVRLPGPVGQTIGVVGGIVIGQAAVQAGIVSNVMVIVVSITAVASFIIPNLEMSAGIRLLRFPMMIIVLFIWCVIGIMVGMAIIIIHILSMESLGVPYGSPFFSVICFGFKGILIRLPWKIMKKRPLSLNLKQENRQRDIEGRREVTKRAREISLFQYILTISGVQVGFGVLTLPREVTRGEYRWMDFYYYWMRYHYLVSLCIVKIMEKHPGYTLLDVLTRYLGKWLGKFAMLLWIFIRYTCCGLLNLFSFICHSHLDFT